MKRNLVLSVCLLAVASTRSNAAPVQWLVSAGGNGHYYEAVAVPERITWSDAQDLAVAGGGYLATITSEAENEFLFNLAKDVDGCWYNIPEYGWALGPWLGGYQEPDAPSDDVGWHWVTGEAFTYTNWAPGQPHSADDMEDHLHFAGRDLIRQSTWNDVYGDSPMWGYCIEYVPEPATVLVILCGLGGLAWRRRK